MVLIISLSLDFAQHELQWFSLLGLELTALIYNLVCLAIKLCSPFNVRHVMGHLKLESNPGSSDCSRLFYP